MAVAIGNPSPTQHSSAPRGSPFPRRSGRFMRLLILGINYAPEQTGIAPYTTSLARHLSKRHQVTVVTGVPHYPDWEVPADYRLWRSESDDGDVRVVRLRHFVPHRPGVVGRLAYELSWAVRAAAFGDEVDAVIAVVPALFGAIAARSIARRKGVPYGLIFQDVMGAAAAQSGVRGGRSVARVTSSVERAALRGAAAVATIHPRLASELQRIGERPTRPSVIFNWTHVAAPNGSHESARVRFGWNPAERIVIHSGNMGAKQNLEVVCDAARTAAERAPQLRFVLAGGGSRRKSLEDYARGCGNITFLDSVPDVEYMQLLASADVLLVNERPGMVEMSLPSKLTSYLRAGRPVVAATTPGSATDDFVTASGGGIVVPAGDPDAIVNAVIDITSADRQLSDFAVRGAEFARQHLSEERALAAYDEWVDELTATREQPREVAGAATQRRAGPRPQR